VAGEFECGLYSPAGAETRLSWTIRADAILSARPKPKKAKPKPSATAPHRTGPEIAASSWARPSMGGDDEIPF